MTHFARYQRTLTELQYHRESDSGRKFSRQTQYNWNEPDDGIKTENEIYCSGRRDSNWDSTGKITKPVIRMVARMGADPARIFKLERNTPEKKNYFPIK